MSGAPCVGGQSAEDQGFQDVYKMGKPRVHPMTIPKTMANAGASAISLEFGSSHERAAAVLVLRRT